MTPEVLAKKQEEARLRNQLRRNKQQSKNASGPRPKAKQPTTRPLRSDLPILRRIAANDNNALKWRILAIYWSSILRKEPLPLPAEIWSDIVDPKLDKKAKDFKIREMIAEAVEQPHA
jgi:hypothetical protein